ncbi:hypothetical protein, partial [Bacillus toyonensis]|uniref:hypothetical protein n=1 Tax=Bacillus toyonensis TaxID=155322 RepID=UPI00339191FE
HPFLIIPFYTFQNRGSHTNFSYFKKTIFFYMDITPCLSSDKKEKEIHTTIEPCYERSHDFD